MSYYDQKKKCVSDIKKILRRLWDQGEVPDVALLEMRVLENYGFGDRVLQDILDTLERAGYIEIDDGQIRKAHDGNLAGWV